MRELLFILTEGTPGQNTRPGERNSIQKTREEDKCYAVNHRDKELRLAMTVCSRNKITARMCLSFLVYTHVSSSRRRINTCNDEVPLSVVPQSYDSY